MLLETDIWEGYSAESVTPALRYWVDYWVETVSEYKGSSYGFKLNSPRILIDEIVDEIDFNNLSFDYVKKFFEQQLRLWLKADAGLPPNAVTHIRLINANLAASERRVLKGSCLLARKYFQSGEFFKSSFFLLKDLLLSERDLKKGTLETLRRLSDFLIVEFLFSGFALDSIKAMPGRIFDQGKMINKSAFLTNYPAKTKPREFKVEATYDWAEYEKALRNEMLLLSVEDRICALAQIFEEDPQEYTYILPIVGITGEREVEVGSVTFYSPKKRQFVNESGGLTVSELMWRSKDDHGFVNAAVKVTTRDVAGARKKAIEQVEEAMDLLCHCALSSSLSYVSHAGYVVVNSEGLPVSWQAADDAKAPRFLSSRGINTFDLSGNERQLRKITGTSSFLRDRAGTIYAEQVRSALHWYRKAIEESRLEERILNFWIVIEKFFSPRHHSSSSKKNAFDIASDILPLIVARAMIYKEGWELYGYIWKRLNSSRNFQNYLTLPDEIISASGLEQKSGEQIELSTFVGALPDILKHINKQLFAEKIERVHSFYSNGKFSADAIEGEIEQVKVDLLRIYRLRNKIVHDAHFSGSTLEYFAFRSQVYASTLLDFATNCAGLFESFEEAIIDVRARVDFLLESLPSNSGLLFQF